MAYLGGVGAVRSGTRSGKTQSGTTAIWAEDGGLEGVLGWGRGCGGRGHAGLELPLFNGEGSSARQGNGGRGNGQSAEHAAGGGHKGA